MDVRLIIDPAGGGSWNMAVDEALLQTAVEGEQCTLRFYQWSRPTLSLGYFQRQADRRRHAASAACQLIRRASGGGAILHHQELTYSFSLPARDRTASAHQAHYQTFHETLAALLNDRGVPASLCPPREPVRQLPFLCFLRRSAGDVLVQQHKVAGSAQRRHRGGLLQQGSVLLNVSPHAPELPGIAQLGGRSPSPSDLITRWTEMLARRMNWTFHNNRLTTAEHERAALLQRTKFDSPRWTCRR